MIDSRVVGFRCPGCGESFMSDDCGSVWGAESRILQHMTFCVEGKRDYRVIYSHPYGVN